MDGLEIEQLNSLIIRYPELTNVRDNILDVYTIVRDSYLCGGKLLLAGNGGSASDCEHITGELMKSFTLPRQLERDFGQRLMDIDQIRGNYLYHSLEKPLAAISLTTHEALTTAYANDVDGKLAYAQQLLGYGTKNDIFLGISTSGNSENVVYAAITAKAIGLKVIALTGRTGGVLAQFTDAIIKVPEEEPFKVQELHLPVYHCLCLMLENYFFNMS